MYLVYAALHGKSAGEKLHVRLYLKPTDALVLSKLSGCGYAKLLQICHGYDAGILCMCNALYSYSHAHISAQCANFKVLSNGRLALGESSL